MAWETVHARWSADGIWLCNNPCSSLYTVAILSGFEILEQASGVIDELLIGASLYSTWLLQARQIHSNRNASLIYLERKVDWAYYNLEIIM